MHTFDDRYTENWYKISKKARQQLEGLCTLCDEIATQTHHTVYRNEDGESIAGEEIAGEEIFPLCDDCHNIAHNKNNWCWDKENPKLGNCNTKAFQQELRDSWLIDTPHA